MKMCYITFRSVTPAQRAERLLHTAGIACALQRTPKWMEEQGCGYSVRFAHKDLMVTVNILRENKINYRKIYLRLESGTMEEIEV